MSEPKVDRKPDQWSARSRGTAAASTPSAATGRGPLGRVARGGSDIVVRRGEEMLARILRRIVGPRHCRQQRPDNRVHLFGVQLTEGFGVLCGRMRIQQVEAIAIKQFPIGGRLADEEVQKLRRVAIERARVPAQGRHERIGQLCECRELRGREEFGTRLRHLVGRRYLDQGGAGCATAASAPATGRTRCSAARQSCATTRDARRGSGLLSDESGNGWRGGQRLHKATTFHDGDAIRAFKAGSRTR